MQTSLAVTALVMGLAGGPHCIAMCGAACAGIGQAAAPRSTQAITMFQLGRVVGYSALLVAALAGSAAGGAMVMALFALGSGVSLWAGPWLLLRLGQNGRGAWSMRVAGLALMLTSAWGLYMGLVHDQAPWCVVPPTH